MKKLTLLLLLLALQVRTQTISEFFLIGRDSKSIYNKHPNDRITKQGYAYIVSTMGNGVYMYGTNHAGQIVSGSIIAEEKLLYDKMIYFANDKYIIESWSTNNKQALLTRVFYSKGKTLLMIYAPLEGDAVGYSIHVGFE